MKRLYLSAVFTLSAFPAFAECRLSDDDTAAVRNAANEYVSAWLANDADRVLAILTEDVVMIPHHGDPVREGKEATAEWWFPEGGITAPIKTYSVSVTEVDGCGPIALVRGRLQELSFEYQGKTYTQRNGNYLNILRKGEDGKWRISHRIWNDPIAEES